MAPYKIRLRSGAEPVLVDAPNSSKTRATKTRNAEVRTGNNRRHKMPKSKESRLRKLSSVAKNSEIAKFKKNAGSSKTNAVTVPSYILDNMQPAETLHFYIRKVLDAIEASTASERQDCKPSAPPPRTLTVHLPADAEQVLVFIIAGNNSLNVSDDVDLEHAATAADAARVRIVEQQGENSTSTVLVIDQWGGTKPFKDDILTNDNPDERIETVVVDVSKQVGKLPKSVDAISSDLEDLFSGDDNSSVRSADINNSQDAMASTRTSIKRFSNVNKRPVKRLRRGTSSLICNSCAVEFESESALDNHTCQENYLICKFCDEKYNDQQEFLRHYRSHIKSNYERHKLGITAEEILSDESNDTSLSLNCTVCERDFRKQKLKGHPTKYDCPICKDEFTSKDKLTAHHKSVHEMAVPEGIKQAKHQCVDCQLVFDTSEILNNHYKETKHISFIQCSVCEEKFSVRAQLREHKRLSHQMQDSCPKCMEIFATKGELFNHMKSGHPMIFDCQKCEEKFTNSNALLEHTREAHPLKSYACVFCEKLFTTELSFKEHQALHLENPESMLKEDAEEGTNKVADKTKIACEKCKCSFSSEFAFRKHNMVRHAVHLFACSICSAVMQSRKELTKHKKIHKEKHKCEQCGRQYRQMRYLLQHIPTHSKERPHPCTTCGFRFHTAERLRKHQAIHVEKRYSCELCSMKFTDNEHLRRHLKSHAYKQRQRASSTIFKCLMCPETFVSPTRLQQHFNEEHPVTEFRCVECEIRVSSFDLLRNHFRQQHKGKVIHCCRICGDAFDKKRKFLTHRSRTHKAPQQQRAVMGSSITCNVCQTAFASKEDYANHITDKNKTCKEAAATTNKELLPKLFTCLACKEVFPTGDYLVTHSFIHSKKFPIDCNTCGLSLVDAANISEHLTQHLESDAWSCTECNSSFSSWQTLLMHMRIHDKASPVTCSICGKTFSSRNTLETHINVHTGNSPYCCNRCSASYKQPIQLKAHLLAHDGRKMYECAECSKTFAARSSLVAHLSNHASGQQNRVAQTFECTICEKVFDHKANLSNHLRTHNGEKGVLKKHFVCEVCKLSFTTQAHLLIHERSHDDADANATSACPVCQKKFKTVKALWLHMRIHTPESPMCPICNKSFTTQKSLEEHMELHNEQSIEDKCENCNATFKLHDSYRKHTAQCCSVYSNQVCRQCGLGYTNIENYDAHIKICNHKQNRRTTENLCTIQPPQVETISTTEAVSNKQDHLEEMQSAVNVSDVPSATIITDGTNNFLQSNIVHYNQPAGAELEQLIEGQPPTELIVDGPQGKVRVQFIFETTA